MATYRDDVFEITVPGPNRETITDRAFEIAQSYYGEGVAYSVVRTSEGRVAEWLDTSSITATSCEPVAYEIDFRFVAGEV